MTTRRNPSATPIDPRSAIQIALVICSVATFSYLAARLGGALVLRPEMIWPLWPGCALLVAVLLLTPRKIWPVLLIAGLSGFALYDVQENLPIRAMILLLVADSIEVLVAVLGVSYVFGGQMCLNSVKALAKYSFFAVILAPIVVGSIAASAFEHDSLRVSVLAEALALLTLTPAILGWVRLAVSREKPKAHFVEGAAICIGLATLAYFAFVASGRESRPALLYSLVPFLLWIALRFGITGTSSSLVLVAFLAIWATVHDRGPFTGGTPVNNVLSLQVFLLVAGASFMVLSAVVEQKKKAERELAQANERLHLAIESGSVGGWEFNFKTGTSAWFGKAHALLGMRTDETSGSRQEFWDRVHEHDREVFREAIQVARERHEAFSEDFRVVWQDGTTHWLRAQGRHLYAANGEPERMLGISVDVTQSKQAEQALRESEQRLRLAMQAGRMYAFDWDVATDVVMRSAEHVNVLAIKEPLPSTFQKFAERIYPDDRARFIAMVDGLTPENPTGQVTFRVVASDDALVWLRGNGRAFFNSEGKLLRVIGMATDVTDIKQTEEALASMTRKLIESQEQERARIGRELHDDINQRLAMLAVELEELKQNPSELQSHVEELRRRTSKISEDVQALSHDLHPSKIEYLGLAAGMKSWCKEFAKRHKIQIDYKDDVRSTLPAEIGLCLFRIVQEALHNAVKHSGVKRIEVELREDSGEIRLVIGDLGTGFDVEVAKQSEGLGLTSMRERVRLVDGAITINSKPMAGTTIDVRIPIKPEKEAQRAVG